MSVGMAGDVPNPRVYSKAEYDALQQQVEALEKTNRIQLELAACYAKSCRKIISQLRAKLESVDKEGSAISRLYASGVLERERFEYLAALAREGKGGKP